MERGIPSSLNIMKQTNVIDSAPNMDARNIFQRSGILANRQTPLYKRNLLKTSTWIIITMGSMNKLISQLSNGEIKNLAHHENCQASTDIIRS